jgi:heme-degrading monooxygenase HmoA
MQENAIARLWRGSATAENADAYHRHVTETVLPEIARLPGHRGALVLRRPIDGGVEFLVVTFWDSMEAVKAFAGDHPDLAVVEPAARAVLFELDDIVRNYTVAHAT